MSEIDELFLPLLFKVQYSAFNPGAKNDLGNLVEAWDLPVERDVYGWGPPTSKTQFTQAKAIIFSDQRFIVAVELLVPPGWQSKHRDRFQLGALADIDDNTDWYRQIGPVESYEANPFGWNPGSVVNLVSASGTGDEV